MDASSVSDASSDAGESRWADDDPGLSCPLREPCREQTEAALPLMFTAASLGEGVRFIAISGGLVLAEREDADGRVTLVVELPPDQVPPRVVELPDAELAAPVMLSTLCARSYGAAAMRCDATECVVSTGWGHKAGFSNQARIELEALGESSLEGVSCMAERERCTPAYRACVYGSGLHCLETDDGTWKTLVAPRSGQRIRGVAANGCMPTLAVGDHGMVLSQASGAWESVETHTDADFVAVSAWGGRYTAAGEGGVLLEGNSVGTLLCEARDPSLVAVSRLEDAYNCLGPDQSQVDSAANARGLDTHLQGLTEDGRLVISSSGSRDCGVPESFWCTPPVSDAIGHSVNGCGASENPVVITSDAVYGRSDCASVP